MRQTYRTTLLILLLFCRLQSRTAMAADPPYDGTWESLQKMKLESQRKDCGNNKNLLQ